MPGTEVKLAPEDGEILIKSPGVMQGYHNLPDATAEALTPDGWLRTGDIGEVDAKGFLRITDRKKDLIKTSGGKYIAPQHIEGKLKAACPYHQPGDRPRRQAQLRHRAGHARRGSDDEVGARARRSAARATTSSSSARGRQELLAPYFDEVNKSLAKYETVKQFAILPKDLTVDEGELTPSLKVKRKVVEKKYAAMLDKMYEGSIADA